MKEIKELRELIGVKQPELAELLNIQISNYSAIENGHIVPKNLYEIKSNCYAFLQEIYKGRQKRIEQILNTPIKTTIKQVDTNCIVSLRKALKLTQSYVSKEINLAQCQYSLLEKGELKLKKAEQYYKEALQKLQSIYRNTP